MERIKESASYSAGLLVSLILFTWAHPLQADWPGTDEEFIEKVEKAHWDQVNESQGGKWWYPTEWNPTIPPIPIYASCGTFNGRPAWGTPALASDGFGMAGLCIGAYRGWIDEEIAYQRIHDILSFYANTAARSDENYYCHYYNHWSGLPSDSVGTEWNELDWTPIDTSWMISGALLAGEYFKGTEVDQLANYIYDTTKLNRYDPRSMNWCEYFIINILGAGSRTYPMEHPRLTADICSATNGWYDYDGDGNYQYYTYEPHNAAPLFWYQWVQHFLDLRYLKDGRNRNHYNLARDFMMQQRDECIRLNSLHPTDYPDYGPDSWFLTATDGPDGYGGYHPWNNANGTVMPIAAPGCMSHTPREAREAMLHYYNMGGKYGCFGFINAYNTKVDFNNPSSCTMDIGDAVMGIECFRSGMPWKFFMRHDRIRVGLDLCGFTSTTNIPMNDNFDSGKNPNRWNGAFETAGGASCTFVPIDEFNTWVKGYAIRIAAPNNGVGRITMPEVDQSHRDLLSFWLRGEQGGEDFEVGLRDAEGHEFRVSINDYLEKGTVSTNWQRVRIPLKHYAVSEDANTDVRILFLGDFNVKFNVAGSILIDDLAFVTDDRDPDPPNFVGAACIDGKVTVRWGYPKNETVVGYNIFRKRFPDGSFSGLNTSLVSAVHSYIDRTSERLDDGSLMEYTVQSIARNQRFSQFASDFETLCVSKGAYRDLDWNDGLPPNTFGGEDGIWGSANQDFIRTLASNGYTGWVRHCSYPSNSSGIWSSLEDQDLREYYAVALQIRGDSGEERITLGFKSTDKEEYSVALNDYAPEGTISTNWTEIVVPLSHFASVDFSSMDIIFFSSQTDNASMDIDHVRFLPFSTPAGSSCFVEAESPTNYHGGATTDYKKYASGLYTLGNSWGSAVGHYAQYLFDLPEPFNEAVLDLVYACDIESGRTIQVSVDGQNCGDMTIRQTEGWGNDTNDFALSSINLQPLSAGPHSVELRITSGSTSVNLDSLLLRSAPIWFREAEHCSNQYGAESEDHKNAASGGQVLGRNWAQDSGDYATYSNITIYTKHTNALLRIRYAQDTSTGQLLTVYLNEKNMGELPCPPTGGWLKRSGEGQISELPLGELPAGNHTLTLQAKTSGSAINLDWLQICTGKALLQPPDTDGDGITDEQEMLFGTRTDLKDSDGDGISDPDEISRLGGGFLTDPLQSDTDDDGTNDRYETIADTDPTDAESFFGLINVQQKTTTQGITLCWKGSTNINYEVSYVTDICDTSTPPTIITNTSSLCFTNGHFELCDSSAMNTNTMRFYRIRTK